MKPSMPQRKKIFLITSIITLFFLLTMGMIERTYLAERNRNIARPVICQSDTQICPDGSAVMRILPSCTFAPCPVLENSPTPPVSSNAKVTPIHRGGTASVCTMEAKICPDGTAVSRSGPRCEFAPCPTPTPVPSPTPATSGACTKDSDCATGYSCIDSSPVTREGFENLRCWKNGAPRPICLSGETRIATTYGEKLVREIVEGDIVQSIDKRGETVFVPVLMSAHTDAPLDHHVVDLILADGRELIASPGHKIDDGRTLGELKAGELIQGVIITSATLKKYTEQYTYDILPAGDTGMYFANGIMLRSTLGLNSK